MEMLHHVSLAVRDLSRSLSFYDAALLPLGYVRVWTDLEGATNTQAIGYGRPGHGDKLALKQRQGSQPPGPGFHLAFAAANRAAVDGFYRAALQNGGRDNGLPGLRPDYGPDYYAAFVFDPDGYALEAVLNQPEPVLRQATRQDIPGIQRVRHSVRENRLVSGAISDAQVEEAMEVTGRGWVVVQGDEVLGFAIGHQGTGRIWALFIHPDHEGHGHARALHLAMVSWLQTQGHRALSLSTDPHTRAHAFYRRAGWQEQGLQPDGEMEMTFTFPSAWQAPE
jgi:GNAT superfamily N-acetyltransferase/catechol 2,3-dioxygenase-like lactoylglutathione lyase family enzyme